MTLRPAECVNLAGTDTGRAHISHSSIGAWNDCRQRFKFGRVDRLTPRVTRPSLAVGRAFAHGLEHGSPKAAEDYLRESADAEHEAAGGSPWIVLPSHEEVDIQAVTVSAMVGAYLATWGAHGETREHAMTVRIRNPITGYKSRTHDLVCRVDAVTPDWRRIIEDKTAASIDKRTLASRLWLDRQVTIEMYCIWRTTGVMPEEASYRIVRKPGIKRRTVRQPETHDDYLARIVELYETKRDEYVHEETLTRDADDFERLEAELWDWVAQVRAAAKSKVYTRNVQSCSAWGGCEFLDACTNSPGWRAQYVEREPHVVASPKFEIKERNAA